MDGGEDEEAHAGRPPIFSALSQSLHNEVCTLFVHQSRSPSYSTNQANKADDCMFPAKNLDNSPARGDPPATTADHPDPEGISAPRFNNHVVSSSENDKEENNKTTSKDTIGYSESLSTDPSLPVFIKRKRGRPRKIPLPDGDSLPLKRKAGRPPKNATDKGNQVQLNCRLKQKPSVKEETHELNEFGEDKSINPKSAEQSLVKENDRHQDAIRFADVGNHPPLVVQGQYLCAVCLSRHTHRQSSSLRHTRSTSFKRFTSILCRTCDKFLCVTPRSDGRTCYDIYHTVRDFVHKDLAEFDRKNAGDEDALINGFDYSVSVTDDAKKLADLLKNVSKEIDNSNNYAEQEISDSENTSEVSMDVEAVGTENQHNSRGSQKSYEDGLNHGSSKCKPTDNTVRQNNLYSQHISGNNTDSEVTTEAMALLLKVLTQKKVICVSDNFQIRLEKRNRKLNNSSHHLISSKATGANTVAKELTRKYRRKGQPRKHITSDEEDAGIDKMEEAASSVDTKLLSTTISNDSDLPSSLFADIKTGKKFKYACGRCFAEFNLMARIKLHMKGHIERKTYVCSLCSMSFRTKGKLAEHRRSHKSEKIHKCPKCEETFKKMVLLRRHMREHQHEIKPYECRICGSRFSYASSLKEHAINKHLGERPFKCSECDQGFTRQINLLEHMRMHTGERPFQCTKCDQSFARKSGLKSHMISHTGEKKHVCPTCGAKFRHKIALTEHQRTHTGEKPFACQHCGQRFAASTTLRNHVRLHTGEKPHKCKVCGTGFAQRTSLNCHMKKHGVNTQTEGGNTPKSHFSSNSWNKNALPTQDGDAGQREGTRGEPQLSGQISDQSQPEQVPVSHASNVGISVTNMNNTVTTQSHHYSEKHVGEVLTLGTGPNPSVDSDSNMMAQAVSLAFSKMVPELLQGSNMAISYRQPKQEPTQPLPTPAVTHQQPHHHHHQAAPSQPAHQAMISECHQGSQESLSGTSQPHLIQPLPPPPPAAPHPPPPPSSHSGRASVPHHDIHTELEKTPPHGAEDLKPSIMSFTSTTPWTHHTQHGHVQGHEHSNISTGFPFESPFHTPMSQGFHPSLLQVQPNHTHGYPEQPRFPFDNRFTMDAWPAHSNWKHKYQ